MQYHVIDIIVNKTALRFRIGIHSTIIGGFCKKKTYNFFLPIHSKQSEGGTVVKQCNLFLMISTMQQYTFLQISWLMLWPGGVQHLTGENLKAVWSLDWVFSFKFGSFGMTCTQPLEASISYEKPRPRSCPLLLNFAP